MVEKYALRRVHKFGHVAELLFTFGLFYIIEELVQMVWGKVPVGYHVPEYMDFTLFTMWDMGYQAYAMFKLLISIVMLFPSSGLMSVTAEGGSFLGLTVRLKGLLFDRLSGPFSNT